MTVSRDERDIRLLFGEDARKMFGITVSRARLICRTCYSAQRFFDPADTIRQSSPARWWVSDALEIRHHPECGVPLLLAALLAEHAP